MGREIPILMITLVIPAVEDLNADVIMDAIGQQLHQALEAVRAQQHGEESEDGGGVAVEQEVKTVSTSETLEEFTETTRPDLLSSLGYISEP